MQINVSKIYPVRDYSSVKRKYNHTRMQLGMRTNITKLNNVAYLRHATEWGKILFYRTIIPNGIIRKLLIFKCLCLFFLLLSTSCENEKGKIEKPNNLLEREAFESVLQEIYLIEGDVRFRLRDEHLDSLRTRISTEINAMYQEHNIDHEQFTKSYLYYMNDRTLSSEIMKNLSNQLVEMQAKEEAKEKDTIKVEDISYR